MTLDKVQQRIRQLSRVNLKIAEYLKTCDLTHVASDGVPCQDPKCKAIARKYEQNEEEILRLLDLKYEMLPPGKTYNVISSLLSR